MADPSLLMNNELPVNGIGFPMPSAGMAFSNGSDMQAKVLPQANPYGYSMYGVGAPGDVAGAHMAGVNQIAQGGDSNSWMGGMGPPMGMPPSMPPYMVGAQPFQNPSPYAIPPNVPNASSGMPPTTQPNAMPFPGGQYPGYSSWPNGPPMAGAAAATAAGGDQSWMNAPGVAAPSPSLKPTPSMGMAGMDPQAPPPVVPDMPGQSLPDLGDVGLADDKARNTSSQEIVNGDVGGSAAATGHQTPQPPNAGGFNSMMSSSSIGASSTAEPAGPKFLSNHPLFGQDGMVDSSAGAMMPAFASGMRPTTVAVTTQHASAPMHAMVPRHPMAAPHSGSNQMMPAGMMYPNHMYPRMPMDGMLMQQPPQHGAAQFAPPVHPASASMHVPTNSQTPQPPMTPAPPQPATPEVSTSTGNSRTPKNISEVLQPLYKLGDEPGRKPMLDRLVQLSQETGTPTLYVPTLASDHTHVDLYRLYEVIKELGGLVTVVRKKIWRRVIENMGLNPPSNVSALASTLRTHYTKLLLPLECKESGKEVADETDRVEALRRKRASQRGEPSLRTNTNSAPSPTSKRSGSPDGTSEQPRPGHAGASALADANSHVKSTLQTSTSESSASHGPGAMSATAPASVSGLAASQPPAPGVVDTSGMAAPGAVQPGPAGGPPYWMGQGSGMQPPAAFPPHTDALMQQMPGNNVDGRNMARMYGGDMPAPVDPYANFPHPQSAAAMMPPQTEGAYTDPRMLHLKNAQFHQWRQQQLMLQQQQQMQQPQQPSADVSRAMTSVSSLNPSPFPSALPGASQPASVATAGQPDSVARSVAATPESSAAVQSCQPPGSVPSALAAKMANPNNVFSWLLTGGSVDGAIADISAAVQARSVSPDANAKNAEKAEDLSTVEHAAPRSVKRKRFSAQHMAQRLGNLPNLWRLHMCLKAGLLNESAQAMDILSIIVGDESTLCLFQLPQQPTVLETLLAHFASCMHEVFGGFDDVSLIADGDAMRRFYPEDMSNKDVSTVRDEQYDCIQEKIQEEQPEVDWRSAATCGGPGDDEADGSHPLPTKRSLPDGLRHISTHIGDLERAEKCSVARGMCTVGEETSLGVTCSGDDLQEREARATPDKLCASWLRHGTAMEAEPSPLTSRTAAQRILLLRAQCASNLIRSLSCLPANERHMCRHFGLMTVIARVHHLFQGGPRRDAKSRNELSTAWWWPALELIRGDLMVTLVNISGQVDLSCLPTQLVCLLMEGLCHWCVSSSSSARDPLPPASACSGLSLQRLSLEALSKISIGLGNVSRMLASLPEASWKCLCGRLVQWLLQKRQSVQYELSLVLLCGIASCDAVSRHIAQQHHCVVTLMMQLLAETESILCSCGSGAVLPEGHGIPSVDLMRRAANLLLTLSRQRCNRRHFAHYQSHLLILAASPFLDMSVHMVLVDLLFQIGLE